MKRYLIHQEISIFFLVYEWWFKIVTSVMRFLFAVDHFVWDYMKGLSDRQVVVVMYGSWADDSGIKRALSQSIQTTHHDENEWV